MIQMSPQPAGVTIGGAGALALSSADIQALAEAKARMEEERAERLDALGQSLAKKRSEAISARQSLGIDRTWDEDLEFYEGIDDANRHEVCGNSNQNNLVYPMPPSSTTTKEVRSNVFVNVTRPYCDAAAARIGDMLMPTDDRAFSLGPTPVPELADIAKGKLSQSVKQSLLQQAQPQSEEELGQAVKSAVESAQMQMAEAKERSVKAEQRIDDWFVECQYHGEARKVIDDCAKLGTGIIKGPVPVKRKAQKVITEDGTMKLVIEEKIAPSSKRIDPLNFFPHGACGENIHNGSYTWERDYLTNRTLQDLKGGPGYLDSQIDKCIDEGPQKATSEAPEPQGSIESDTKDRYEVWYFHGLLDREDFEAIGSKVEEGDAKKNVYAIVTMVNSRVIKAALNPLDTGDFPYDVMVWQRQSGKWTGIGVSRQIRTPQRMVNAATRNMMDNAGLSAGPQIVMKLGVVTPADGNNTITPRKIWYVSADCDLADLNAVFRTYNIESKQAELMSIIQFGLKLAEDVTGLPLLLQGQQGSAPDTLGGIQMLSNNSSTVLRRLAKLFDDGITEPHVRRYYVWLMQYGEDSEKGDFQIDARGSSALVERDIQNQAVGQMANIISNTAFGVDPKKWFAEWCKSQRLDPKSFQYSDEDQKKIEQAQQQGPTDPRLAVAQLRAQTEERMLMIEQQFETQQNERDRQVEIFIAEMEQAGQQNISLADLKARLADTAIKARVQRDLSQQAIQGRSTTEVLSPPSEPRGKAAAGRSFQA